MVAIACPERYVVGLDISDSAIKTAIEVRADCVLTLFLVDNRKFKRSLSSPRKIRRAINKIEKRKDKEKQRKQMLVLHRHGAQFHLSSWGCG